MNSEAQKAFINHLSQFQDDLDRLKKQTDDHFDTNPDSIDWGDVAEMAYLANQLHEISDRVFHEGEYEQF